jgi:hypothetical protein
MGGSFAALGRRFELLEGSVTARVVDDPKRLRTIVLGTPNDGFIAVRPGEAQVVASPSRAGVACLRGGARVKHGKKTLDLRAGEAASLTDGESLAAHPLDGAPTWKAASGKFDDAQPLAVALGSSGGAPALAWETFQGATGYRVEIASEPNFGKVLETVRMDAKQHHYVAKNLAVGSYFARLIALDADGIATRPSMPAPLRVVSIVVPLGGYADAEHGTVIAPEGSSLKLSDPSRLEMAVDDHKFAPTAAEWQMDGASHVVRLRIEGDYGRESRLIVEPRALKADVRLTPATARWPSDPVDITVTIQDTSGRYDPESVTPALEVLVGVEPASVEWKREGSTFTARLAPRAATSPEVVRVIVHDQNGALLGRNFLEIEPALDLVRHDKQLAKQ